MNYNPKICFKQMKKNRVNKNSQNSQKKIKSIIYKYKANLIIINSYQSNLCVMKIYHSDNKNYFSKGNKKWNNNYF